MTISANVLAKAKIRMTLFIPKERVPFVPAPTPRERLDRRRGGGFPPSSPFTSEWLRGLQVLGRDAFFHLQKVRFQQPAQGETPEPNSSFRPSNRAGTWAQRTLESLLGHGRRAGVGGDTRVPATCLRLHVWAAKWRPSWRHLFRQQQQQDQQVTGFKDG